MKFISKSLKDTQKIAEMLTNNIYYFSNILLFWEVWAWKTHFIKYFLNKIWVEWQIKSPTYSFSNFYEINNKNKIKSVWHYDIYRLENWENLEEINENFFSNDLVICEWAEKLNQKPENRIEIFFKKISENEREISFNFIWTSLNDMQINRLYDFYKTPEHIKKHIAVATNVAIKTAENLIKKWILIDKKLVWSSAKMHDLVRYVDFNWWIVKEKIPYEVDDETIEFWQNFSEKCKWLHHSEVASDILDDLWYPEISQVVNAHKTQQIFEWFQTIEEKIVYYADKRALHDNFVSLKERIEDWKIRYKKEWNSEYWEKLEIKLFELEKELFVDF